MYVCVLHAPRTHVVVVSVPLPKAMSSRACAVVEEGKAKGTAREEKREDKAGGESAKGEKKKTGKRKNARRGR